MRNLQAIAASYLHQCSITLLPLHGVGEFVLKFQSVARVCPIRVIKGVAAGLLSNESNRRDVQVAAGWCVQEEVDTHTSLDHVCMQLFKACIFGS
jgi:hypothetical protein